MSETLWWVDVETTGLMDYDKLLEVAFARSDLKDPFHHEHVYCAQFKHEDLYIPDENVRKMHTKSGLVEAVVNGKRATRVIEDLLDLIPTTGTNYLAGNSVHFDRRFLRALDRELDKRFSHRHYDVSAVKLFAMSLGMPPVLKAEAHRAVADIDESVTHARACAEWFANGGVRG